MQAYEHRQRATWLTAALCASAFLMAGLAAGVGPSSPVGGWIAAAGGLLLLAAAYAFRSLTVRVDPDGVRVWFGPGWVRRRIAAEAIVSAQAVRNRWYYGWGVRLVPGGWMFNLSGLDAVELRLRHGRAFRIGTDEPEELLAALRGVLGRSG